MSKDSESHLGGSEDNGTGHDLEEVRVTFTEFGKITRGKGKR